MDSDSLIGPAVVAAVVSALVSIIGFIITTRAAQKMHKEKLDFDRALAERKFSFDKDLSERKFQYDRDLLDHKRRVELAEDLVSGFHQIRDVIMQIRSPLAYSNESADRVPGERETENVTRKINSYYVPIARLKQNGEFIQGLLSKRYRAQALFGADIDLAFQSIISVLNDIHISADGSVSV